MLKELKGDVEKVGKMMYEQHTEIGNLKRNHKEILELKTIIIGIKNSLE